MGGSRVQVNKAHKSRFASKSSRLAHRISHTDKSRNFKPDKNAVKGVRAARIQRSKMLRDQKRAMLLKEKRALSGAYSSPRIIVLCGLSSHVNLDLIAKDLFVLLCGKESGVISTTVTSQTYKLRSMVVSTLKPDTSEQEPLIVENIPDPLSGEQTWPTEEDMAEADSNNKRLKLQRRRVPPGTSDYQAAWIVEDSDDDISDGSVEEGDGMVLDGQKGNYLHGFNHSDNEDAHNMESFDEETEADIDMADDANLTREQIEAEIKKHKDASGMDEDIFYLYVYVVGVVLYLLVMPLNSSQV